MTKTRTRWNSSIAVKPNAKRPLRKAKPRTLNKKRANKRKRDNWGPVGYVAFVKSFGCECRRAMRMSLLECYGEVQAHHVTTRGALGKGLDNLVPLCAQHHWALHNNGRKWFDDAFGLDLRDKALLYGKVWRLSQDTAT